jgi:hypothetical protein
MKKVRMSQNDEKNQTLVFMVFGSASECSLHNFFKVRQKKLKLWI